MINSPLKSSAALVPQPTFDAIHSSQRLQNWCRCLQTRISSQKDYRTTGSSAGSVELMQKEQLNGPQQLRTGGAASEPKEQQLDAMQRESIDALGISSFLLHCGVQFKLLVRRRPFQQQPLKSRPICRHHNQLPYPHVCTDQSWRLNTARV